MYTYMYIYIYIYIYSWGRRELSGVIAHVGGDGERHAVSPPIHSRAPCLSLHQCPPSCTQFAHRPPNGGSEKTAVSPLS